MNKAQAWQQLADYYQKQGQYLDMRQLFAQDAERTEKFSWLNDFFYCDFSKHRLDDQAWRLLCQLAEAADWQKQREQLFRGEKINHTEQRAVLHTALRAPHLPLWVEGEAIHGTVQQSLNTMADLAERIRNKSWRGFSGKPIQSLVNIGIGGSDLGPKMAYFALQDYAAKDLVFHFVSNVDGHHLHQTLAHCDPETTLFIVASKTFTTQETLTNAESARRWCQQHGMESKDLKSHFLAITAAPERAQAFGIETVLGFWDWVGGRYSLWSAIGLPLMIAIGQQHFQAFLAGAQALDRHFQTANTEVNLPVILALLSIWYRNFFGCQTQAILPYHQYLSLLPAYLQQLEMESNGKSVDREGKIVPYDTAGVIWGAEGTNGQHAFYQMLHQGTSLVPADFIAFVKPTHALPGHQEMLLANYLAQMQALMQGKDAESLRAEGIAEALIPHKTFSGNRPSTALLAQQLDPKTLGFLIALYEQKVFVQASIWEINAFDQWGVELGKQLAKPLLKNLQEGSFGEHDASTNSLLSKIYQWR
jgi:glucose-6-phosphate isomerase